MNSERQEKVARAIQKEFGDIFLHYSREHRGTLISVSEVRVTSDLSIARVYLSIFPSEKADELMEAINHDNKTLRYELGRRMHNQLRVIPEITFFKDETLDKLEHIDELLKNSSKSE